MAAENEVKNFRYNTMPLLGSWEKPPAAVADRDNEEVPTLLSDTGRKSLFLAAMKKTSEESEVSEEEDEADGVADEFIALVESPTRNAEALGNGEERLSFQERRTAQQETSARLVEHRKQRMPWMMDDIGKISSPLLRLHTEITEFVKLVTPTAEEKADREAALARTREMVKAIWPSADLQVFGSYATDMYLPTSDIDCVVLHSGCTDVPSGLKALANASLRRGIAKGIQVIPKATVPLFKYEDVETGVKIDVSFNVANGPAAAAYVLDLMKKLPPMRPLVIILKVFLQQRELNEVYSGGIGSYALLVMVASFLQLHQSRWQPEMQSARSVVGEIEGSLGVLLVDFMRLYGRTLNIDTTGVSCTNGGSFISKRERGFYQAHRPFLLSVADPNDPENDLGRNSFNIIHVRAAFDHAYHELTAPAQGNESVLARIFRLDPVLMERKVVAEVESCEEGEAEGHEAFGKKRKATPEGRKHLSSSREQKPKMQHGGGGGRR